jgi:hypothetical protein
MDHLADGAAFAGLFARFTENGEPMPSLFGSGKLNMKMQGDLGVDVFENPDGTTATFYYIAERTNAEVWLGLGKIGEGVNPDKYLRCGFTNDANGNRTVEYISLR